MCNNTSMVYDLLYTYAISNWRHKIFGVQISVNVILVYEEHNASLNFKV